MRGFNKENKFQYVSLTKEEDDDVEMVLTKKVIQKLIDEKYIIPTYREKKEGRPFLVQENPEVFSYPFEWSFDMLKDASLVFLKVVHECIEADLSVHTASSNSIVYHEGRMKFRGILDISGVSNRDEWPGYSKFLEVFVFPLFFGAIFELDPAAWWKATLRGMSFDEAVKLLKKHEQFQNLLNELGIPLEDHFKSEICIEKGNAREKIHILKKLLESLEKQYSIQDLHWKSYQRDNSYTDPDIRNKENFITQSIAKIKAKNVVDIGANTGHYSKLAQGKVSHVVSVDSESVCIDDLYGEIKNREIKNITPLLLNLLNPTTDSGFSFGEYKNIFTRINADFFLMLAFMHHITPIHVDLDVFVKSLKNVAKSGVIEWISPDEEMLKKELKKGKYRHKRYDWNYFIELIQEDFEILETMDVHNGYRKLCLLGPK